jgi:hypothetical protein
MNLFALFATRATTAIIASCALVACSGATNNAPVIDKLDMPDIATQGSDKALCGTAATCYLLQGTVDFHDDDGAVTQLRVYIPASKPEPVITKEVPSAAKDTAAFALGLSGVPAGTKIDYEVAVVDAEGQESLHAKKSVVLP